jgi:hypothetical protein
MESLLDPGKSPRMANKCKGSRYPLIAMQLVTVAQITVVQFDNLAGKGTDFVSIEH